MKRGKNIDSWYPLWIDKWIFGSTRHELILKTGNGSFVDLRGVFLDLVAIAKKDDGYIRANERTPYPMEQLSGMFCVPLDVLRQTIDICIKTGKLSEPSPGVYYLNSNEIYELSIRHKKRMSDSADIASEISDASPLLFSSLNKIDSSSKESENPDQLPRRKLTLRDLRSMWNTFAHANGLSEIESVSPSSKRWKMANARLNDPDFDLQIILGRSINQRFLFGENDKGWRMTFDWIIAPSNYPKVLEGQYLRAKDQRVRVGENKKPQTEESKRYWAERDKMIKKFNVEFAEATEKAIASGDRKAIDAIEMKIKEKIAEWSKGYR